MSYFVMLTTPSLKSDRRSQWTSSKDDYTDQAADWQVVLSMITYLKYWISLFVVACLKTYLGKQLFNFTLLLVVNQFAGKVVIRCQKAEKILDEVAKTSTATIVTIASKACFQAKVYLVLGPPMGHQFLPFGPVNHPEDRPLSAGQGFTALGRE